jgi:hypothetical protein
MKLTQETIKEKLSDYSIPHGKCVTKAFEIVGLLFEQKITQVPGSRYATLSDALEVISKAILNKQIGILWIDTGPVDPANLYYRANHCYFVFQDKPLMSFAVWQNPGAEFYDEKATRDKIEETISFTKGLGGIEIHIVPCTDVA